MEVFFKVYIMTEISNKGKLMPESPIRKLVPFAEKAKSNGIKVHHLNIGQPDIGSPITSLNAIRNFDSKVIEYSHSAGYETYRRGLGNYYNNIGIDIKYSDLIITTGGSEALLFGLNSCLDPGDEIIIPEPFYANYNGFSISAGIKVVPVTTSIKDGFSLPNIEEFQKLITPKTKAILICNPGNPTGYLYSKQELDTLRDIVIKNNLFLFADEVYREFVYDNNVHYSILNLKGLERHAIVIDSTSKRYSMCGIRIGCIVSRNKNVISTALKFAQARLSPPTFGQVAAEAALETPKSYFTQVIHEYVNRRNLLIQRLNNIEGVECPMPKGAFYAIAQLPVDNADRFAQWLLEEFQFNQQTLMVAPAAGFYSTKGVGLNQVRIAYVLNTKSLNDAIDCLEEALKIYPGRKI